MSERQEDAVAMYYILSVRRRKSVEVRDKEGGVGAGSIKLKGCPLRVEPSRSYFLEILRLGQEQRRETMPPPPDPALTVETTSNDKMTASPPLPPKTKRHLRIRKQYGYEFYSVHNKYLLTSTWSNLSFTPHKQ